MRRPIIEVWGPSGRNLAEEWGSALLGVTVTDKAGYESDEAVIRIRATPPEWTFPPKGTKYTVRLGWEESAAAVTGIYSVQRVSPRGAPDQGTMLEITCRAADFMDKMKEVDSGHYDDKTVGDIVRHIAGKMGVEAVIAPELANIKIPYRMRFQQSNGDFLTHLADQVGGIIKPQAGKLLVLKRGAGKSAGGSTLPTITVTYDPLFDFEADLEPRPQFKDIEGGWIDAKTGLRKASKRPGGFKASRLGLVHPFASEAEAELGADAAAQEHGRKSATAKFSMPGEPKAVAEAPVKASGYGADIDAVAWIAAGVTHEASPDQGWVTTIDCDTKGKGDATDG